MSKLTQGAVCLLTHVHPVNVPRILHAVHNQAQEGVQHERIWQSKGKGDLDRGDQEQWEEESGQGK